MSRSVLADLIGLFENLFQCILCCWLMICCRWYFTVSTGTYKLLTCRDI